MAELGSILADPEAGSDAPRGPDLHVEVEVPRAALGAEDGFEAPVPREVGHGGERVARASSPLEDGEVVTLRLPESFPDGGTIKLRGQGGTHPEGRPGDLLVTVSLADGPWPTRRGKSDTGAMATLGDVSPAIVGLGVFVAVLSLAGLAWLLGAFA